MHYSGPRLIEILKRQSEPVNLFDSGFRLLGVVTPDRALEFVDRLPVGVGNGRLIRELRPAECVGWMGGSRTVRRIPARNQAGEAVTGPKIVEHKPLVEMRRRG